MGTSRTLPCCKSAWATSASRSLAASFTHKSRSILRLLGRSKCSSTNSASVSPSTQRIFKTGNRSPPMRMPCSRYWKSTVNGRRACSRWAAMLR